MKNERTPLSSVLKTTWALWRRRPGAVLWPFFWVAAAEAAALVFLHLAPRPPVLRLLGPIIRRYWGEAYLHYPLDLVLLPTLFQKAQVAVGLLLGPLMAGAAVWMISRLAADGGAAPRVAEGVRVALRRFFAVFAVAALVFLLMKWSLAGANALFREALSLGPSLPRWASWALHLGINLAAGTLAETLFVFSIPAIVVEDASVWRSLGRSLRAVRDSFAAAFSLVALPVAAFLALALARIRLPALMERTVPEASLWFLAGTIVVSFLVNAFLVSSTAVLFLDWRRSRPETGAAAR